MGPQTPPPQPPADQPGDSQSPQTPPEQPAAAPVRKSKRKRWLKIGAGVVVFLILVAVFAPSLLSTGIGRGLALRIVNGNLNGKLEIADWSLGWRSGVVLNGIKLLDDRGDVILHASRVRTQLPLWTALRSGFNELPLGNTQVDHLDLTHLHVDADGTLNLAKVFKPSKKESGPAPNVSGDIRINDLTGNITAANVAQTLRIMPSKISLKLAGINDPIENDLQLVFSIQDPARITASQTGTISLVGQADLFDKGVLQLDRAIANEELTLTNVDVAAINPFLALASLKLELDGTANGALAVNMRERGGDAVSGTITVTGFVAGGEALNNDRFASTLRIPIKIKRITDARGAELLKVEDLRIVTDFGDISVTGNATQASLRRLAARQAPGSEGQLSVVVNFDKADRLFADMPRTLQMLPDAKIDSAHLLARLDVWLKSDRVAAKAQVDLKDIAGSNKTGKFSIAPIASTADVTYVPTGITHSLLTQFQDVGLSLRSAFANAAGKGETLARFSMNGETDFAKLAAQIRQFSSLGDLDIQGMMKFSGQTSGDPAKPDAPIIVSSTLNITGLTLQAAGNPSPALKDQTIDVAFSGLFNATENEISGDFHSLSIIAPKLLEIRKKEGDLKCTVFTKSARINAAGGINLSADAKRIADVLKAFSATRAAPAGPSDQLTKALLNGSIMLSRGDKPLTAIAGDLVADVSVSSPGGPIDDKITLAIKADAPDDLTQPLSANIHIKGNMLDGAISDAVLVLARKLENGSKTFNGPLELLNSAKINVNIDRIDAVQSIVNSFSPAAAPAPGVARHDRVALAESEPGAANSAEEAKPLPPIRNLKGKLTLAADLAREGRNLLLRNGTLALADFSFDRGDGHYASKDKRIGIKVSARLESAESPAKSFLGGIRRIVIDQLSSDLDAGQLKLTRPIVITQLAAAPQFDGAIQVEGRLADGLRLLEALQAAKPASKYPYTGYYALEQTFNSTGATMNLAGSLKASKFKAYDPANLRRVTFSEDLVTLSNDISITNGADPAKHIARINHLELAMQSTGALAVKISGGALVDWTDQRKIADKLTAHLKVDWPRFWVLVKPMLDPQTLNSLDDLALEGVMERDFSLSGSFPATGLDKQGRAIKLTTPQSLRFLNAYGGLAFDRVYLSGVDIRKLDLPVSLEKGILYIQDAAKPKGQRYPRPFICNSGTIDLGGIQIDLRHMDPNDPSRFDPHLTIPPNKQLVSKVTLNPVLAQTTLGSYVNPGFAKSKQASGLVSVTSVECRDLPFSWFQRASNKSAPAGDGRAHFTFSIQKVHVDNPVLAVLIGGAVNGDINKATVTIEKGAITSDIPIVINDRATLGFAGTVNLMTGVIKSFNASVPKSLFNPAAMANLPPDVNRFIPATIIVPFKGTLDKPEFDPVKALIASATGGGKPGDILKNLPDLLNLGKKEKK